jgi:single-strand DNA-binding protein
LSRGDTYLAQIFFWGGRRFKEMLSLNKAMIIGNVGGEPEMRFTPNGNPVTSFSVATNRVYATPDGERRQETEWFSVVTWNRLAENCNQFLTKGQRVYAEGRLHTRTWEGQEGQKHSRIEIIANRVIFLDKRVTGLLSEEKAEEGDIGEGGEAGELTPEDIPF